MFLLFGLFIIELSDILDFRGMEAGKWSRRTGDDVEGIHGVGWCGKRVDEGNKGPRREKGGVGRRRRDP